MQESSSCSIKAQKLQNNYHYDNYSDDVKDILVHGDLYHEKTIVSKFSWVPSHKTAMEYILFRTNLGWWPGARTWSG
jgi:hypothetical protein